MMMMMMTMGYSWCSFPTAASADVSLRFLLNYFRTQSDGSLAALRSILGEKADRQICIPLLAILPVRNWAKKRFKYWFVDYLFVYIYGFLSDWIQHNLLITLVVQVEQSDRCGCLCVPTVSFELEDLWPRYLACWFNLTLSRLKVKVIGQSLSSHEENVSIVADGTSNEGLLVI